MEEMENKPVLYTASFKFYQEGNSDGTTSDTEELTVELESHGDLKEGFYMVLKTSTGWSIDNVDELKETLDRIKIIM